MMTKRSILAGLILLLALCLVGTAAAANGFLNVDSDPQTALIYIGDVSPGSFIGYTPMSFQIAEGDYNLILKKIGYEDVLQPVHVTNNSITSVTIDLTPVLWNEAGGIHLVTTPPGASAFIKQDGQPDSAYFFLGTTPLTFSSLTPGNYTIKIELPGYYDRVIEDVEVNMALVNEIDIKLDKIPTTGFADLRTEPPGATVTIDGSFAGNTTFPLILELAPGTHLYLFELDGYENASGTFDIAVGETTNVWVTLERLPSNVAVYFTSVPSGAEIYIDGVELENVTPILESIKFDPGEENLHNVSFELDGYKDFNGMLDLNAWFQGGEMYRYPTVVLEPLHIDICDNLTNGNITPADGNPVVEYGEGKTYYIQGEGPSWEIHDYVIDGTAYLLTHNETFYQYTFPPVVDNHTICAHFVQYNILVTSSAGPGGQITPAYNNMKFPLGSNLEFTFIPDDCYEVVAIIVNGQTYTWSAPGVSFTNLQEDLTLEVLFGQETFDVTASSNAGGTVSPSTQTVDCGDSAPVTIAPNNGFMILTIYDNGMPVSPTTSYVIPDVEEDHDVVVTFGPAIFTITATAGPNGTISPSGQVPVNYLADQTFTITPDPCFGILDLTVDGVQVTLTDTYTFTGVTADHTISVNFTPTNPEITASVEGEGGIIVPNGSVSVACGDEQDFDIIPDSCHMIDDIEVDGMNIPFDDPNLVWDGIPGGVGVSAEYDFDSVTADHTILVDFAIATFNVTTIAGPNGQIQPTNLTVECGDCVTLNFIPAEGFAVSLVTVDGVPTVPPNPSSIELCNITSDILVEATFVTNAVPDFDAVVQPITPGERIPPRFLDPIAQPGMDIKFFDRSSGNPDKWVWDFGDGNFSSERNPIHRYSTVDSFDVSLKVHNAAGWSNPVVKEDFIIITNDPLVDFSFEPAAGNVPPPFTVQFQDETVDIVSPVHAITWDFGDGSPVEVGVRNPQHTYVNYGTYTVTLRIDNVLGKGEMSKDILITAEPVADFIGFPTRGPANLTVQFTDLSQSVVPLTTWFWNFGDGSFSSDQNPGHTYYTPGKYNVTLNVTNTLGDFNILRKAFYIDVR